jgi:Abnormal spindle-like microcephaly-assoc'd, ASPM-SPD-2-Hydin
MNCSGSRVSLLRLVALGLAGALVAAGCGGEGGIKTDGPRDGASDAAAPALRIVPTSQDFGSVVVGGTSANPVPFTVSNATGTTGMVNPVATGDFAIVAGAGSCGDPLRAAGTCTVQVVFKPTATGARTGMLTVTATPGGTVSAVLTGTGQAAGSLTITPMVKDFGSLPIGGTSAVTTFTVANPAGGAALSGLTVTVSGAGFTSPTMGNRCTAMLAAGANCTVDVIFSPMSAGGKTGSLIASAGGQTVTAALSGNGQSPATLAVRPMVQPFTSSVGVQSAPVTFTFIHGGEAPTGMLTTALGGADRADFVVVTDGCVASLSGGNSCTVSVAFRPTSAAAKNATLTVSAGGMGGASATAMLTGSASTLSIDPPSADYGTVNVNVTAAAKSFTVRNGGSSPTSLLHANVSAAEFTIVSNTCEATLAPNTTCTVSVTFRPVSAGSRSAVLTIAGAGGETVGASLTGVGNAPLLTASPSSPNFGTIPLGSSSAPLTITVTNGGTSPSGALMANLGGPSASQWAIMGANCNAALAPMATCTVALVFSPTTVGDKSATLTVTGGSGESVVVNLVGSGIAPAGLDVNGITPDSTVVGQTSAPSTFVVTNTGMAPTGMLTISFTGPGAGDYSVGTSNNCVMFSGVAGESCAFTIVFKPTVEGARNASVIVRGLANGSGVQNLSSVGLGAIGLTNPPPAPFDFGQVTVGLISAPATFTFDVRGPFTTVTASTTGEFNLPAAFTCVGGNTFTAIVPTNPATFKHCSVDVTFNPVVTKGVKTGSLVLTGAGGTPTSFALTGTGTGPMTVSPTTLDFMTTGIPNTTSGTQVVTVTNNGGVNITALATVLSNNADFEITDNGCTGAPSNGTLPAGGTCDITVAFAPDAIGAKTGTLTINGTFSGGPETAVVNMVGSAAIVPTLTLTPSPALVTAPLGGSGTVTVTLTNPAGAVNTGVITINQPVAAFPEFSIDLVGATNTCQGVMSQLLAGQSCSFVVTFTPDPANNTGMRSATLSISTVGGGGASITVTGTATQSLSISPTSADFPALPPGSTNGVTTDFTVANSAGNAIAVTATIEPGTGPNANAADFTIVGAPCASVPASGGGGCHVLVQFTPQAASTPGPTSALLHVVDASGNIVANASLTSTVAADAVVGWLNDPAPAPLDFQEVVQGTTSAAAVYTLRNTGGVTTGVVTFTIAAPFVATGGPTAPCVSGSTTLAPNASCSIAVSFAPTAQGAAAATLAPTVALGDGVVAVTVPAIDFSGTGVAPAGTIGSLAITPSPANLGDVAGGATGAAQTMTFHNSSNGAVMLTAAAASSDAVVFEVAPGTCTNGAVIAAAGTCTYTVTFKPAAGATPGVVAGTTTVATTGGTRSAALVGRVRNNAILRVTPPATGEDFGDVVVFSTSAARDWTVTNDGELAAGALVVSNTLPAIFSTAGTTCTGALAPAASCIVRIAATPQNFAAEVAAITLTGTSIDNALPITIANAATRGVHPTDLTASATADFGATNEVGNTTAPVVVTITNSIDPFTLSTGPLVITQSDAVDFTVTDSAVNGCAAARISGLAGGTSCNLDVVLTPHSARTFNESVTVTATPGGTRTTMLVGTSVSAISIMPNPQPFTAGQEVLFTVTMSPGTNPTTTGELHTTITGPDAGLWTNTGDTCNNNPGLVGGGTCTVRLLYSASATGTRSATLNVTGTQAGDNATAALTGS